MKTPSAAAIYARISLDKDGDRAGVARQLEDCRAEAKRRGIRVVGEYVDDDVSAYSGKPRPQYQRMLEDVEAGIVDAIIIYHHDRLHRHSGELEDFLKTCDRAGMTNLITLHGDVDMASADGLLVARIMAAVAANESAAKGRRVRRKILENAREGKGQGGGSRAFGFEDDKVTIRESEAQIIRRLADRFLAGESLNSLTRWLNDHEIQTPTGRSLWSSSTVRQVLRAARTSGQIELHGEIIGPAQWPAIIEPTKTAQIRAILDDLQRKRTRPPRRYLLASLLVCGRCGETLKSHPQKDRRRYVCQKRPDTPACGRMGITAVPVEELISRSVLMRLDTPQLQQVMSGAVADNPDAAILADELAVDQAQLDELSDLYADRQITAQEWTRARKRIEARMATAKGQLHRLQNTAVLDGLVGNGQQLRSKWADLNLTRQQAIIAAVLDHAIIQPAPTRGGAFDINRVQPVWRL